MSSTGAILIMIGMGVTLRSWGAKAESIFLKKMVLGGGTREAEGVREGPEKGGGGIGEKFRKVKASRLETKTLEPTSG